MKISSIFLNNFISPGVFSSLIYLSFTVFFIIWSIYHLSYNFIRPNIDIFLHFNFFVLLLQMIFYPRSHIVQFCPFYFCLIQLVLKIVVIVGVSKID